MSKVLVVAEHDGSVLNPSVAKVVACAASIDGIPDVQLHWIIQRGSPGTAMPSFDYFSDEEIWQLVIYLRSMTDHD